MPRACLVSWTRHITSSLHSCVLKKQVCRLPRSHSLHMWPWGSRSQPEALPEEVVRLLERRSKALSSAYKACIRANRELEPQQAALACKGLEVSLVTIGADHPATCQTQAQAYKACVNSLPLEALEDGWSACASQYTSMIKCLQKFAVYGSLTGSRP